MMRKDTEREYRRRIGLALEFIRDNLDRDPGLDEIAAAAFFSAFHFNRVLRGVTGESVRGLVRRLRLERAAWRLVEGSEPVMVIALRAGYESAQSFTRAFLSAFGETPSRFRALRGSVPVIPSPSGFHYCPGRSVVGFEPVRKGEVFMDAKTVQTKTMKVLCMRHAGPYHLIGEAFERLDEALRRAGMDVAGSQWLAIYHDDPDSTPPDSLRSDACVTVDSSPGTDTGGMTEFEIPGGLYATSRHVGSYRGIGAAWGRLVGSWIPANGLRPRNGVCYEIYVKGHECTSDESEFITDLYEPVEPL